MFSTSKINSSRACAASTRAIARCIDHDRAHDRPLRALRCALAQRAA
jgi:hypothetical protein